MFPFFSLIPLQLLTSESLGKLTEEASRNIGSYRYFKKHYPDQFKEYKQQKENFKLRLDGGDIGQLLSLPGALKELPPEKKKELDPKIPKYRRVKRQFIADDEDSCSAPEPSAQQVQSQQQTEQTPQAQSPQQTEQTPQAGPRPKRLKVSDVGLELPSFTSVFETFASKVCPNASTEITIAEDGTPYFSMTCLTCSKKVRISYKITKQEKPCFVKTNWYAHKCNRAVLGNMNVNEDSGSLIIEYQDSSQSV